MKRESATIIILLIIMYNMYNVKIIGIILLGSTTKSRNLKS
jgi:hypothetical protein